MDYFLIIWSVVVFVENRLHSDIDYTQLEKMTGFSFAHIREVFVTHTGKTLSRYILNRKIANAAFEMLHGEQRILDIASKYNFSNPDTFTRAFKRITGMTPQAFRKQRPPVGRIKLCAGVYGIGILNPNN